MGAMMLDGAARMATRRSPRTPGAGPYLLSRLGLRCFILRDVFTATGDYLAYGP